MNIFCDKHWTMLRQEVEDQGMGKFIGGNGEIAAMKMMGELQSDEDILDNFDPLMRCFFMLMNKTLDIFGPTALFDPEWDCTICKCNEQVNENGSCKCSDPDCHNKAPGSMPNFEIWLTGPESCVWSVKKYMQEKGWLDESE